MKIETQNLNIDKFKNITEKKKHKLEFRSS